MSSPHTVEDIVLAVGASDPAKIPWNDLFGRVDRAFVDRDWAYLARLLEALDLPPFAPERSFTAASHLAEVVFRALALVPGEGPARGLLELVDRSSLTSVLAAALASAQPIDVLARLSASKSYVGAARAVIVAWAHESVYHDGRPSEHRALVALANELREQGDPLGRVPLFQTVVESTLAKSPPGPTPRSFGSWGIMPAWREKPLDSRVKLPTEAVDVTDASRARRIQGTFRPEGVGTNARIEARRFLLASPTTTESLGAPLLRAFPLACMTGYLEEGEAVPPTNTASVVVRSSPILPAHALACFLHFSIGWRCYGQYAGVGPGRARAYDAMAALCDLGSDAPWDDVDRALMERGFATFETDTRWFDHDCEDFGLLVLDPSGTSVDVVAETDSA